MLKLGRSVQALHGWMEKKEAKRIERISKERLKALKAGDEEAYMKVIDSAKDTYHTSSAPDRLLPRLARTGRRGTTEQWPRLGRSCSK